MLSWFALLDEPCVFSESARIKDEWFVVLVADLADRFHVLQRDWLAANRVAGDGDHHEGNIRGSFAQKVFQSVEVHVAFERRV